MAAAVRPGAALSARAAGTPLAVYRGASWTRWRPGIARIEAEAGVNRLGDRNPARFQDEAQALLRKRGLIVAWRSEVDGFFQKIDPALEAQLYPADAPRRLVVQLYGSGIAVQREQLWSRFKGAGVRVPLDLEGTNGTERFLEALFGAREPGRRVPALFAGAIKSSPFDAWLIESHEALHALCATPRRPAEKIAGHQLAR